MKKMMLLFFVFINLCGCSKAENNSEIFEDKINYYCTAYKVVELKQLTPFSWDKVYFFKPYTDVDYIYGKVGYKWARINVSVDDTMMQIVFMNKGKVVCYIDGAHASTGLTYAIYSPMEELHYDDNPKFIVTGLPKNQPITNWQDGIYILNWFDDADMQVYDFSKDAVGRWESRSPETDVTVVISEEGYIYGSYYSKNGTPTSQKFIGQFKDANGECSEYTTENSRFVKSSKTINIDFVNGQIKITFENSSILPMMLSKKI